MKNYFRILYNYFADQANRYFFFHVGRYPNLIEEEQRHWKCYKYLQHKYQSFLDELPEYKVNGTTPKIVWWCWLQGEDNAPAICRACLSSLRRHLPDFEIKIVTESNVAHYVSVPDYIITKYRNGIIPNAHYSDILRTLLLVKYGGVWIDSTVYCTGYNTPLFDRPFFMFQNWKFDYQQSVLSSNWLIASCADHPILKTTRDLLFKYWEDSDQVIDYYIFHLLFHLAVNRYPSLWQEMPRYSNIPPHILQFELSMPFSETRLQKIKDMSDFHKLNRRPEMGICPEGSFYQYLLDC